MRVSVRSPLPRRSLHLTKSPSRGLRNSPLPDPSSRLGAQSTNGLPLFSNSPRVSRSQPRSHLGVRSEPVLFDRA